jgi:hypothetical protein
MSLVPATPSRAKRCIALDEFAFYFNALRGSVADEIEGGSGRRSIQDTVVACSGSRGELRSKEEDRMSVLAFLARSPAAAEGSAAGGAVSGIIALAIVILMVASMWKLFVKAGEPGWAAIIPIYNVITLLKVTGKPIWWIILFIVPVVNVIIEILLVFALAKRFGKGAGFALGILFLSPIFLPLLAFGDAQAQPLPA